MFEILLWPHLTISLFCRIVLWISHTSDIFIIFQLLKSHNFYIITCLKYYLSEPKILEKNKIIFFFYLNKFQTDIMIFEYLMSSVRGGKDKYYYCNRIPGFFPFWGYNSDPAVVLVKTLLSIVYYLKRAMMKFLAMLTVNPLTMGCWLFTCLHASDAMVLSRWAQKQFTGELLGSKSSCAWQTLACL